MSPATIFVTYDPRNDFEQTLAVRLQTLGAVHGLNMLTPDRNRLDSVPSRETLYGIRSADYFIFFSISELTPTVQNEVQAAVNNYHDPSRVIIIYDRVKNTPRLPNCTEVYANSSKDSVENILQKVMAEIHKNQIKKKSQHDAANALGAILLVGLGLLVLHSVTSSSK